MLHHALDLEAITLAKAPAWPAPLSLFVPLAEIVLIEGVEPAMTEPLLAVAATLESPVTGKVRHWGLDAETLPREDLYQLRGRMAYISPRQVLLSHLTLGENIALVPCYRLGCSEAEALAPHAGLLEHLKLPAHLDEYPAQVSSAVASRAVWARELLKEPELILAALNDFEGAATRMLLPVLEEYLPRYGAAAILLGKSLEPYYPLGHRLLRLEAGQLLKQPLLENRARPLTAHLPLV
jgi:ABC-type methionine transport system ATPase subunit